ncbi:MAG: radical SAM protein [Elusimicrobia bacterium]|nr:radical SAM protein [Elusimicrobiota bacterium]
MKALTLVLTRRCPARCGFCPQEFKARDMSRQTLRAALRGLGPCLGRGGRIKLFGGEPLLKPGLVRAAGRGAAALGLEASFELSTQGKLMDEAMCRFLAGHPEVEVFFGRPSPWVRRLPGAALNFILPPGQPAEEVLARLRQARGMGFRRFNFLPVYFKAWTPAQLAHLRRAFAGLARAARGGIEVLNLRRAGRVPLYNDGWCVDTDGKVYASNLVLVRDGILRAGRLALGDVRRPRHLKPFPPARELDGLLESCFSPEVLEGTRRADAELTRFVLGLQRSGAGASRPFFSGPLL